MRKRPRLMVEPLTFENSWGGATDKHRSDRETNFVNQICLQHLIVQI